MVFQKKLNLIKGRGAFISTEYKEFCKARNIEIQYCPPRMHTENGTAERAIQTRKNLVLANMEGGNNITESVKRALNVMRFTIPKGLKKHHLNYITVENRERSELI